MSASVFCITGGHTGPEVDPPEGQSFRSVLPEGWHCLRVRRDRPNDLWIFDPSSDASIVVCNDHLPVFPVDEDFPTGKSEPTHTVSLAIRTTDRTVVTEEVEQALRRLIGAGVIPSTLGWMWL